MAEQWIEASKALELAGSSYAICARLQSGLIRSRARLVLIDENRHEDVFVDRKFWWAGGHEALDQDWTKGDFSTWIDHSEHWQAFGVTFALAGVLEMLPFERRGVVARSLSVAASADWVPAKQARQFAYKQGGVNPAVAGRAIIEQARLGFLTARAVLAQGSTGGGGETHWSWDAREWDVTPWFWECFTDEGSSSQDWELGRFGGRGKGPNGLRRVTLTDVHFLKDSLGALLPALPAATSTQPISRNPGGRPPAAFSDELMCAIWALIYQGDLKPKNQADIERAMLDWATHGGHDLGVTTAREKARKVFAALSTEVRNPGN